MKDNPVQRAVEAVGGPTKAAILLQMSGTAVHAAIGRGFLPNTSFRQRERLRVLADASGVPMADLAGLTEADATNSDHHAA